MMNGTDSRQADILYRGIIDYYSNISGLDITLEQMTQRNKFITDSAIVCDDSLDEQVLALQEEYLAAGDNALEQKAVIEKIINLLAG
ncbi:MULTISPECIES: hypothetical protein [Klebsiella]|uniref:hypothetical protein n=1 Tax=Klebsiella TaxID=570 RepID=UPI00211504A8|nr:MULTISPECIES: hypothetical protein [Klebsiella]MEB2849483.1 hypothetical protein [Klebsiella oxytoca]MEB2875921.1 hypothetical protein [Klebsiella oxytoca]